MSEGEPGARGWRRLAVWSSPPGQPRWARPALLAVAAVAAFADAWRLGSSTEIFYAAADRSMASGWHDFFFAAFDPAGTVSIDKLPGAFWVQALSVRAFGPHPWAVALPQVVEGVLTVLVLFRAVRRCAGPGAGLIAAALGAAWPATVTLDRGNVADTLLVLLLVLAADALVAALRTGRTFPVVCAGCWVGLAFQAKMLEAWLVLPALLLALLVAAPGHFTRRLASGAALTAAAVVVSLSWVVAVSLIPHQDRPYVDGTSNDSVVSQVFDYNGFGRVGGPSPNQVLGRTLGVGVLAAPAPPASATRLFEGAPGRDTGWLLPAALLAVPALLWARRRRARRDPVRAAAVLWGTWLAVYAVVFSVTDINSYYLGALAPPIAALLGVAAGEAWHHRRRRPVQVAVMATVAGSVGYAWWLMPASGTGLPGWLAAAAAGLGAAALVAVTWFAMRARSSPASAGSVASALIAAALVAAALVAVPLAASVSVVRDDLGAFDTPFQPLSWTAFNRSFFEAPLQPLATLPAIEQVRHGAPDLLATQTSVIAAPLIFATGQEVLPIGGYDGATPAPTPARLREDVATGRFHLVLTAPRSRDLRVRWIRAHCLAVRPTGPSPVVPVDISYCLPADAG